MNLALTVLAFTLTATPALAQTTFNDPANLRGERVDPVGGPYGLHPLPIDQGTSGLQQLLRRLNTRASILNIVAHPDDEDGGMLTLYSRGLGARVADLSLTRGEGGQNDVTGDFEDALGLLRTQELLSNDRYTGVDQMFGTEVDFGFSKTKEESFAKWTHQRVLYDAVRAIRLFRPLVITATFIGGVTDGHGQHQVSGEIAQEAFVAAADPTIFPDQIAEGLLPWQALKVYARVPRGAVTDKGLFDYATGQYTPARFTNYVTGAVTTTIPSTDVVVHEGATDPLLDGKSYVQFARIGLSLQKSQIGPGVRNAPAGAFDVSYHLYGSALQAPTTRTITAQGNALGKETRESSRAEDPIHSLVTNPEQATFFDGIDTTIEGIASLLPEAPGFLHDGLKATAKSIANAQHAFDPTHSEACAPPLAEALSTVDRLIEKLQPINGIPTIQKANVLHELRIKRVQLNDALALALGVEMQADTPSDKTAASSDGPAPSPAEITPAEDRFVRIKLSTSNPQTVRIVRFDLKTSFGTVYSDALDTDGDNLPGIPFPAEGIHIDPLEMKVPANAAPTKPYFSRPNIEQPFYDLSKPALRNAPATPPPFIASVKLNYRGTTFELVSPVVGTFTYASGATITEPVSIIPPISIASSPPATVFPTTQSKAELTATLTTTATTSANVNVQSPHNWTLEAKAVPAPATNTDHSIDFYLHPTVPFTDPQIFHITAQTPDHHTYTESFRPVGYPGLISTNDYTPATTRIVPVDLTLPAHRRIAYLPGTGDAVPQALASIGLPPTILTIADLTPANLAQYDTVILGVRTYNAHPDLHGAPTQALLDYARNGGNVLVQYQTYEFTAADAPYPLTLGNAEKVVDETDPVQLLSSTAPLLITPNRITPADFNNWIEERGHGFLHSWDPHYTALTETNDPGQLPQRGGLITIPLGKGRWTYCAFALYRQLPEAVPGAYRLFVNLLDSDPTP